MTMLGYEDEYSVFVIDDGETHWCVAMSRDEALRSYGVDNLDYASVEDYQDDVGPLTCESLPWSEEITVEDDDVESVTKTAREWAIEKRGVFCSTIW